MKKFRKLFPAFVLLLISAIMITTASYAWFSMNSQVTVTGMAVKTQVSDNLLIADDTITSTAKQPEANFGTVLNQVKKGYIAPVSTVDGKNFYYTSTQNVTASGDAIADTYFNYATTGLAAAVDSSSYGNAFSENSGITSAKVGSYAGTLGPAEGYLEYVFQLKAMNLTDANEALKLTQLEIEYAQQDEEVDNCKAFRVAVFVQDITSATPLAEAGTLKAIYTPTGAANFTAGKAVNSTTTLGDVTYAAAAVDMATVAPGTAYYKVVVRLWLEGEDTTCNNDTFMALTGDWTLKIQITLGTTAVGVSTITKTVGA